MVRRIAASALGLVLGLTGPAAAQQNLSSDIARNGLAAVESQLSTLTAPSDADLFALGGVRFLRAIERSLQTRWRLGMNHSFAELPVLRLPVAANPAPEPYTPDAVATIFRDIASDMAAARVPLSQIPEGADFGVKIVLNDLWFDVNANGSRDADEDLLRIAGSALVGRGGFGGPGGAGRASIRFDTADAAWLSAYTHFLEGAANLVLGYDPTNAIARSLATNEGLAALNGTGSFNTAMNQQMGFYADRIAVVRDALVGEPDADRLRAARVSLLGMIAENRRFWIAVNAETDNVAEWIPNDRQTSALGLEIPAGTGEIWLDVLSDGEALLRGEKLIPYWRLDSGAGINLARMLDDPRPIDIVDWIQGSGALPYAERGPLVTPANWRRFERLVLGDAMMFAILLN